MPQARILDLLWIALLNDFRWSGLTHAELCDCRNIPIQSFRKHDTSSGLPAQRCLPLPGRPKLYAITIRVADSPSTRTPMARGVSWPRIGPSRGPQFER
jgi:hypothetical protein